jgi:hypothetical protein
VKWAPQLTCTTTRADSPTNVFKAVKRLLKQPPLVPREEADWQLACFEWLLHGSGGFGRFRRSVLVLPTDEFFPQRNLPPGALEGALFEQVKKHAGMSGWRCTLDIQIPDPDPHVAPTIAVQGAPQSPLGTFHGHPTRATITYRPGLLADPMSFVATMAHELGHFLVSDIAQPVPGGDENLEFATDLAAAFLGFGVFLANAAFTFAQFDRGDAIGWSTRRQGYLTEPQLLNALSIFTVLRDIEPHLVTPHLKGPFRRPYRAACSALIGPANLESLRAVAPIDADTREIVPRSPHHRL